ncbi:MAG: adenylate/guanylate cyclase domain-containing protein [Chloroflexota bacterium]
MTKSSKKSFQQEITNLETTIAAIEANRPILGDLPADTALELLRERLATLIQPETARDERKRVTVLFADVKGYTALSENLDPEDVAGIMNRLFEAVTVEIHRYGGTIDKYAGDAVMALFGAPQALENHEEMAARASLAMQRVIREFSQDLNQTHGFQLQMRIGLNTGEVLAGLVGGLKARSYTVMGDTVNLAARLESAAPVGGILASEYTTRKLHNIFELSEPEKITVKGKSDEITVFQIISEKRQRGRVRGLDGLQADMIGRDDELTLLQNSFQSALANRHWHAFAIKGEAGLGKTRLQRELISWVYKTHPQTRILSSRSFNHTRTTPYHFIAEMIRGLFNLSRESAMTTAVNHLTASISALQDGITPLELDYQLGSLASILGLTLINNPLSNLEPEQRRDRTFLSLERIFIAAAKQKPLMLLIDDLHWGDVLSLDFLERLLTLIAQGELQDGQAFVMMLSRPAENPDSQLSQVITRLESPPFQTILLDRLDETQAASLIIELLDQEIPQELGNLIINHAQGNPFYVEEVLRSLIEDGTLKKNGTWKITQDIANIRIPPSVQDVLAARIDRLPPDDKQITQHAAIIGRIFWQDILNRITEAETVEPTLLLLELRQLAGRMEESKLAEDWEWVFHHGLIQEVAYGSVPKSMRRVVHEQVATILENQLGDQTAFLIPLIANHYEQSQLIDKAIYYLGLAGQQATEQFANQEAVSYYTRALNLLDSQETTIFLSSKQLRQKYDLILGRVKVYHLMGKRSEQKDDLDKLDFLAKRLRDKEAQATVALEFASYFESISDFSSSVTKSQEAVELAQEAKSPDLAVSGYTAWSLAQLRLSQFDEAKQLAIQGQKIAQENNNALGEAISLVHLGIAHYLPGEINEAKDALEASLEISEKLNDLSRQTSCLTNLVGIYHGLGDYAKAVSYCEKALELVRIIGNRATEATIVNNLGAIYHALGYLAEAEEHQSSALRQAQLLDNKLVESMSSGNLSLVLHDMNLLSEAEEISRNALKIDQEIGDKYGEGYSLTALGLALEGQDKLDSAKEAHQAALTIRQDLQLASQAIDNLAGLASISLKQHNLTEAKKHIEEIQEWISKHGVEGIEYPIRVYLTVADVLEAVGESSQAAHILDTAKKYMHSKAEKISNPVAQESFLTNVPLHQELDSRFNAHPIL